MQEADDAVRTTQTGSRRGQKRELQRCDVDSAAALCVVGHRRPPRLDLRGCDPGDGRPATEHVVGYHVVPSGRVLSRIRHKA